MERISRLKQLLQMLFTSLSKAVWNVYVVLGLICSFGLKVCTSAAVWNFQKVNLSCKSPSQLWILLGNTTLSLCHAGSLHRPLLLSADVRCCPGYPYPSLSEGTCQSSSLSDSRGRCSPASSPLQRKCEDFSESGIASIRGTARNLSPNTTLPSAHAGSGSCHLGTRVFLLLVSALTTISLSERG